jgi:hypothetical protein
MFQAPDLGKCVTQVISVSSAGSFPASTFNANPGKLVPFGFHFLKLALKGSAQCAPSP